MGRPGQKKALVPDRGVVLIPSGTCQVEGRLICIADETDKTRRLSVSCTDRGSMYIKPYSYTVSGLRTYNQASSKSSRSNSQIRDVEVTNGRQTGTLIAVKLHHIRFSELVGFTLHALACTSAVTPKLILPAWTRTLSDSDGNCYASYYALLRAYR